MTGTGFMKCMPITCSGRLVRAAISVIEIELVFVARIASGFGRRVELAEDLELEVAILGRRFDDERRVLRCAERLRAWLRDRGSRLCRRPEAFPS